MIKDKVLCAWITEGYKRKAKQIGEVMGLTTSHILRRLIDSAEVQTKPTVLVGEMKNSSDSACVLRKLGAITASA